MTFNPRTFLALIVLSHLALLAVLFFGTPLQIVVMLVISAFNITVASTVTYHRLLSHRSFNAPRWFEIFGTILGIFSFTGTPITRVLMHRYHHAYADGPKDPHSPLQLGKFRTYFPMLNSDREFNMRLVGDILKDPFHVFIHRYYMYIVISTVVLAMLVFGPMWGAVMALAPGAMCWMNISICNMFCHAKEGIKDSWFLALLTFGEGWHNFHHEHPNEADFGQGKWDPGYWVIRLIEIKDSEKSGTA